MVKKLCTFEIEGEVLTEFKINCIKNNYSIKEVLTKYINKYNSRENGIK